MTEQQSTDETLEAVPPAPAEGPGTTGVAATADGADAEVVDADAPSAASRLEEEGDVAADYLEELLDIADLDGDIDIDVEDGRASLSVVADPASAVSLRRLVGEHGQVLEALQELTRLAVQARTGQRSRLMLDVAGYRAGRRADLEEQARAVVEQVRADGTPVRLEPMNPFERKVVHDVVAATGLVSDSEGVEPQRRVVVHPAAP